jgi:hypothetical protein
VREDLIGILVDPALAIYVEINAQHHERARIVSIEPIGDLNDPVIPVRAVNETVRLIGFRKIVVRVPLVFPHRNGAEMQRDMCIWAFGHLSLLRSDHWSAANARLE